MARYSWYTEPDWSTADQRLFWDKLSRCRDKAGALNQKGNVLQRAGKPRQAIVLLERVVSEYPDDTIRASSAREGLGHAYRDLGDLAQAEEYYRAAMATPEPNWISRDALPLFIAELIVDSGDRARFNEATDLVADDRFKEMLLFRVHHYRLNRLLARVAAAQGDLAAASKWAREALALAELDREGPQLARHPDVGRIAPSRRELRELNQLAS